MSNTLDSSLDDAALQRGRLVQFVRAMLPVAVAFGLLYAAAAWLLSNLALGLASVDVMAFAAIVAVAQIQVKRGEVLRAALLLGVGLLGMTALGGLLIPFLRRALLLIPIGAVALVLPYAEGQVLRRFMAAAVAAELVTVVVSAFPPLLPQPPQPFDDAVALGASTAAMILTVMLLWQDSARLRNSVQVAREQAARSALLAARYGALVEVSAPILWTASADGSVMSESPAWQAFTGQPAGAGKGEGWLEAIHPEDRAQVLATWRESLATRSAFRSAYRLRRAAGGYAYAEARAAPVRDVHGEIIEWSGSIVDLSTEHELARVREEGHAEARRIEVQFRALFDAPLVGILFTDFSGRILEANDAFLALLGYTREDVSQGLLRWDALTPPEYQAQSREILRQLAEHGVVAPFEKAYLRKDGTRVPVLVGSVRIRAQDRNLTFVLDITARKRAEQAMDLLARAGGLLATVQTSETLENVARLVVPDLADVCFIDLSCEDGGFDRVAVAGASPALEPPLKQLKRRYPPKPNVPFGVGHVMQSMATQMKFEVTDPMLEAVARDAAHLEALRELQVKGWVMVPLLARYRVFGVLTLGFTTERRATPAELELVQQLAARAAVAIDNAQLFEAAQQERRRAEEANRLKDEFLATVSHELRTPLTSIMGWSQMLLSGAAPADRQSKGLQTIDRNARALAQLVEDLLDVSRIISGKMRLDVAEVQLDDIVRAVIDVVRPTADARGTCIDALLASNLGPLVGDAQRLQQVVWNLLSNAIKFTQRGGRIQIVLRRTDSSAEIIVSDNGQGIPRAFLPHLFERFRQGDGGAARRHGGLGLGLSIVRHLVELHGGTITADSPGPDQGSTFTVKLPIAPVRAARPTTQERASEVSCLPVLVGRRVLVVDDEKDIRELLSAVLTRCGLEVSLAASAEEALAALPAIRPELVISDIGMPVVDGYTFIQRMRALPPEQGGRTPSVALTAYARTEERTRALLAGYNMHLPKPVVADELLAVLASLIRDNLYAG